METVIWILQCLLAAAFAVAGLAKLAQPKEKLVASGQGWVEDFDAGQVKGIGALELLAAIGLILPAALDIAPALTAVAAAGVVLLMLGAGATHLRRGEAQMLPVNIFNDDPSDTGIAGIDIFKMDADGRAIEHWEALQLVGTPENSASRI
jgi:uncharacterized membrane protein YphA (DoxX/SURF4 family)